MRARNAPPTIRLMLLHGFALTLVAPAAAQTAAREVYTRADLEAAGLHRFSEVIQWVSGWSATVEGVSWGASLDGLPSGALTGVALPDAALLVNGQRIAVDAHGVWMPDAAPVLAQQIDSVVVTRVPGLAGGSISSRGTIHVHARAAPAGASAFAAYRNGAETGDPGPYLWTARATPNVDRTGPDLLGILAYGRPRWDAELSVRYIRQDATDPRLRRLHGEGQSQFVYTRGPALRVGLDGLGGRHELLLSRIARRGSAYYADVGRMSHALLTSSYAGVTGSIGPRAGPRATYRLSHANGASQHPEGPGIASGRGLTHGSLEWRVPAAEWQGVAALAVESWRVDAAGSGPPPRRTQGSVTVAAERSTAAGAEHTVAASLSRVGGRVADRLTASSEWGIGAGRRLHLSGSSLRLVQGEAFAADSWTLPGRERAATPARLLRSEAGLSQGWSASAALRAAALVAVILPDERRASREDASDSSSVRYRGARVGARLALTMGSSTLRARVAYEGHVSARSSDDHSRAAALVPRHAWAATVAHSLAPTFRIAAAARMRSATRWHPAHSPTAGAYELEPVTRLDLSAEKWLWRRRVRAQFLVRNALDSTEIHHPAGAAFGMRYFLVASMGAPGAT